MTLNRATTIAAVGASAVILALVVIVLFSRRPGDGPSATVPTQVGETAVGTVSPTTSPEPTTATPSPLAYQGATVQSGTVGPTVDFPRDTSLLLLETHSREGGSLSLVRASRQGNGPLRVETLLAQSAPGNAITGLIADPLTYDVWASECVGEACYLLGGGDKDRTRFLRSRDGGVTWAEVASIDGRFIVTAMEGDQAVAFGMSKQDGARMLRIPSLTAFTSPTSEAYPSQWQAPATVQGSVVAANTLAWATHDGRLLDGRGAEILRTGPSDRGFTLFATLAFPAGPLALVSWAEGADRSVVIALPVPAGRGYVSWDVPLIIYAQSPVILAGPSALGPLVDPPYPYPTLPITVLTATVETEPGTFRDRPVFFDWGAGVLNPIRLPASGPLVPSSLARLVGGRIEYSARVSGVGKGDCLNVRRSPDTSAEVLACYAAGVLLPIIGIDGAPQGWWPVKTLDGRGGWAATQYLQLPVP